MKKLLVLALLYSATHLNLAHASGATPPPPPPPPPPCVQSHDLNVQAVTLEVGAACEPHALGAESTAMYFAAFSRKAQISKTVVIENTCDKTVVSTQAVTEVVIQWRAFSLFGSDEQWHSSLSDALYSSHDAPVRYYWESEEIQRDTSMAMDLCESTRKTILNAN